MISTVIFEQHYKKKIEDEEKKNKEERERYSSTIYLIEEDKNRIYKEITNINFKSKDETNIHISEYWKFIREIGDSYNQIKGIFKKFDEKLKDIRKGKNKFKEIIIIQQNELKDEILIKIFDKIKTLKLPEYYLPFIIFIPFSNDINENKTKIEKQLNNYKSINKKNIFCEQSIEEIKKRVCSCCAYYNELGDLFSIHKTYFAYINVFCVGNTGAGKSTFINLITKSKRAKTGGNLKSCTSNINHYQIENYPIRLYDLPGVENQETLEMNLSNIENLKDKMKQLNERIHLILYFIDGGAQVKFNKFGYILINTICDADTKIFFIETHAKFNKDDENQKDNYIQNSNQIRDCISSIIDDENKINNLLPILDNKEIGNFFSVNLKETQIYNSIIPIFGVENLLKSICDIFNTNKTLLEKLKKKIEDYKIEDPFKNDEIKNIIKSNYFLKDFSNYELLVKRKEKEAREMINRKIFQSMVLGIFPIIDIIGQNIIKYQIREELSIIYGFQAEIKSEKINNKNNSNNNYLDGDIFELNENERKQLEKEENDNNGSIKGSILKLLSRIGSLGLNGWNFFYRTVVTVGRGVLGITFAGIGIVIGAGTGAFMAYMDGEELIPIYNQQFMKHKDKALIKYIDIILEGFNFFNSFKL